MENVIDTAEVQLFRGDCREVMASLPDNSVDSIVTDPPYELGFMGKGWDSSGIAFDQEVWAQAFRVLKPGGHALVFGGTRTWHRVAVAVEDAGFEIRDSMAWLYGSGFPKSLDVAKAIDKMRVESMGRWPANVILDESQAAALDEQSGTLTSGAKSLRAGDPIVSKWRESEGRSDKQVRAKDSSFELNSGGASRFFYVAKAPAHERPEVDGTQHATVKPLTLMRYLVKLVTPPGGTVLEPFAGSGTTLEAALLEGFNTIGAELDQDGTHIPLIRQRLGKPMTPAMF